MFGYKDLFKKLKKLVKESAAYRCKDSIFCDSALGDFSSRDHYLYLHSSPDRSLFWFQYTRKAVKDEEENNMFRLFSSRQLCNFE